jgi:hypothetical protein
MDSLWFIKETYKGSENEKTITNLSKSNISNQIWIHSLRKNRFVSNLNQKKQIKENYLQREQSQENYKILPNWKLLNGKFLILCQTKPMNSI